MRNQILSVLKITLLALSLSFGLSFVYAWTTPAVTAPGGNVAAPINTSATTQTKTGDLTVNKISANTHCIGADCRTAWPSVAGVGDNMGDQIARGALNMNGNWLTSPNTWGQYVQNGLYATGYISNAFSTSGNVFDGVISAGRLVSSPIFCLVAPGTQPYYYSGNTPLPNCITSWSQVGGSGVTSVNGMSGAVTIPVGGLGVGKKWQSMSGAKFPGTTYTNGTGSPIAISYHGSAPNVNTSAILTIDGVQVAVGWAPAYVGASISSIVPDGSTYSITNSYGTAAFLSWYEL